MDSRGLAAIAITALIGCGSSPSSSIVPERLPQAAYVWQRNWTPGVRDAVAHPPAGIDSFRVLVAEVSSTEKLTTMTVDAASLVAAHVPITLVVRIEGSRPIESLSLAPIVSAGDALREGGVDVVGIEVDHDCATARLGDYARWLYDHRPPGYRFSITALPTWASGSGLLDVANAVDEIVVQVHAVRAPMIFDANTAWRDLARFAQVVRGAADTRGGARITTLRVALPTYSAVVRDVEVSVDPDDVVAFVDKLQTKPIVGIEGVVWFRLPVEGDGQTWSRATFARVVSRTRDPHAHGGSASGRATIELVAQGDSRFDIVVSNPTDSLVEMPSLHIAGDIGAADVVMGYRELGPGRYAAPRKSLAHNERIVIGWIHGKDLALVD